MITQDQENLKVFLQYPLMFVRVWDKNNIISFLSGYEFGSLERCTFQKQLRELLVRKYKVRYLSDGWPGQLARLAKRLGKGWEEIFRLVALEVLESAVT